MGMDSSGPTLTVCAFDGQKMAALRHTGIKQEQFLLPLVNRLLAKFDVCLQDVKKIFIVRGPGRFTGIRISLTFASMLQSLNGTEVASATVFEILHLQAVRSQAFARWKKENPAGVPAVVLHAFRDEYFLQFFDGKNEPPLWLSKEQLLEKLAMRPEPLYCVGTDKNGACLLELLGDTCRLAPMADCRVRPQTLIDMSFDSEYMKNALEPLYLKPARFELGQ